MEKDVQDQCDETCEGTKLSVAVAVKEQMLTEGLASSLADVFKALGEPTRIKIIYALMQQELCVHDIAVVLDMGQSAISHQLRYLRNMRIVKRRKQGKTVYYSLDDSHIEQIFTQTLQHVKHG